MFGLILATAMAVGGSRPAVGVISGGGSEALSRERSLEVALQIVSALAGAGFDAKLGDATCPVADRDCGDRVAAEMSVRAVVLVEGGEVRGSVAVQVRALVPGQVGPVAEASFILRSKDKASSLTQKLAGFARALEAALTRLEQASAPAPAPAEPAAAPAEPAVVDTAAASPPAPALEAPAERPEVRPLERDRGPVVFLRGDVDLLGGFGAALGGGYAFGLVAAEATLLIARRSTGARLELRLLPFDFAWVRPFAAIGATFFFAQGWGAPPGSAAPLAVGPRGAVGAELKLGAHVRLRADVAVEGMVAQSQPAQFRPVAVLIGGGAAWQF